MPRSRGSECIIFLSAVELQRYMYLRTFVFTSSETHDVEARVKLSLDTCNSGARGVELSR